MAQSALSPQQMYELKRAIWDGMENKELMAQFKVSYSIIMGVRAGRTYPHIPWPDGSVGAMPDMRKEELKNVRETRTLMDGQLGPAPTLPTVPLSLIHSLNQIARANGFSNIEEMERHYKNIAETERIKKINAENDARLAAYEEAERIRMLPENVEARRLAREALPVDRDDICDPDLQEMITEEEFEESDATVVGVAKSENDPALKLAIRICFKLFSVRQRSQDHVLKNIYNIAGKINKFWDENPERRPPNPAFQGE